MIYVDYLKMAGPTANLPNGWKMLRQELRLEDETPLGLYLGCRISKGEATLRDKTKVQTVTYDMETYLEMTVKKYCDVTGFDSSNFKTVPSPNPAEETKHHPAKAPAQSGKSHRCTWIPCLFTRMVDLFRLHRFPRRPRKRKSTNQIAAVLRLRLRVYS